MDITMLAILKKLAGGGGGKSDIFFVTRSMSFIDNEVVTTIDKSFSETYAAFNAGKCVVFVDKVIYSAEETYVLGYSAMTTTDTGKLVFTMRSGLDGTYTRIFSSDNTITDLNYMNINHAEITNQSGLIMKSSTAGSSKRFRVRVYDDGKIDATEVT